MTIRPAVEQDLPQLMALKHSSDPSLFMHRFKQMSRDEGAYIVAEENGRVYAHVFLDYYGRQEFPQYPDIVDLFVSQEKQGIGLGTELIVVCEEIAKQKGFNLIGLSVNPTMNARARRLYERLGYFPTGEAARLDGVYNGVEDWVIDMTKRLEVTV
jgi:GNAT superfamily N-acetyltransferase